MAGGGETLIPVKDTKEEKVEGLIGALAAIQNLYRREKEGNKIAYELVGGVNKMLEYFSVGFFAALKEGIIFLVIVLLATPILADPWLRSKVGSAFPVVRSNFMVWFISTLPVITGAGFCCFLSKYYIGNSTRKAITSLLSGRLSALFIKGFLSFAVLMMLSSFITPEGAAKTARTLTGHHEDAAYKLYRIIMLSKPLMMERAFEVMGILTIGVLTPFLTVWGVQWYRTARVKFNLKKWNE